MRRLKELVKIISKLKVSQIHIVGNRRRRRNKSDEFYEKLLQEEFKDDEEASQYFFGTDNKSRNYLNLKKRLETNLLNTVFFIDYKSNELRVEQRAYFQLLREITACKIFIARGIHQLTVEILQRCLKKAITFGFTEFAYDAAKLLSRYYGTIKFDQKEYENYYQIASYYRQLLNVEELSQEYYTRVLLTYKNDRINLQKTYQTAKNYYDEIAPFLEQYSTYRLHLTGRLLELFCISLQRDIKSLLLACDRAITFFESLEHVGKFNFIFKSF